MRACDSLNVGGMWCGVLVPLTPTVPDGHVAVESLVVQYPLVVVFLQNQYSGVFTMLTPAKDRDKR